ncbi:MAG: hypothetical protein ABI950_12995 [Solirubrobacteraceae bacterium]
MSSTPTPRTLLIAVLGAAAFLVLLIGGCGTLAAYKAPTVGKVGICQSGGPLDDRGTCGRPAGG